MLPEMTNQPINWTDGMKLNKDHFIGQDNWVIEGIRDNACIRLTDYNYGLLSSASGSSLELLVNIDQNSQINIKLTRCRAITKGGRRIELTEQDIKSLNYPMEKLDIDFDVTEATNDMFDIILAVYPENRIPVGTPVENEVPFRHPFVMPEYRVHVVPSKQVNSSQMWNNHITIGKFQVVAREVHFYIDYIPPCTSVDAHPVLVEYYYKFENTIEKLTNALAEYLRKNRTNQGKLEMNICYVVEKLVYYFTVNLSSYKMILKTGSPVHLVGYFISFARLFKATLSWLSEYDREEVLNYFSHWVSSRDIDNAAFELINLDYDHQDVFPSLKKVENYMDLVHALFEKMVFSGKQASPVKDTAPPKKAKHGPVIIRDGKRIN